MVRAGPTPRCRAGAGGVKDTTCRSAVHQHGHVRPPHEQLVDHSARTVTLRSARKPKAHRRASLVDYQPPPPHHQRLAEKDEPGRTRSLGGGWAPGAAPQSRLSEQHAADDCAPCSSDESPLTVSPEPALSPSTATRMNITATTASIKRRQGYRAPCGPGRRCRQRRGRRGKLSHGVPRINDSGPSAGHSNRAAPPELPSY